jgi:hypothetical protein
VEKAVKETRDKKATGDDDVPGDVLELLGEDGLIIMTQQINSMCDTGEWPKDFSEVNNDCLKEEARSYKMQRPLHNHPHRTYSKDSSENS